MTLPMQSTHRAGLPYRAAETQTIAAKALERSLAPPTSEILINVTLPKRRRRKARRGEISSCCLTETAWKAGISYVCQATLRFVLPGPLPRAPQMMNGWIQARSTSALLIVFIIWLGLDVALAQRGEVAPRQVSTAPLRWREGTELRETAGAFRMVGDRVVFTLEDGARQVTVLENLALERVLAALRQASAPQTWLVNGTVTEYQSNNYLLLERAILRRSLRSDRSMTRDSMNARDGSVSTRP